jgi:uncharacterized Fe-S center protein
MSDVFLVDARAASVRENYVDKIRLLFRAPGFAEMIPKNPRVTFVKANYSPIGYTRHIRPVLVAAVVESIRDHGGNPAVTDTSGFFPRGNYVGEQWFTGADMMGYSEMALGCERVLANGYEGDDGEFISTGGAELGGVEVARAIREAACLVVASHFTAHPMAGLSGAIVNVGLESLNNSGKARVYEDLKPDFFKENCKSCGTCVDYCQWQALSRNAEALISCQAQFQVITVPVYVQNAAGHIKAVYAIGVGTGHGLIGLLPLVPFFGAPFQGELPDFFSSDEYAPQMFTALPGLFPQVIGQFCRINLDQVIKGGTGA